MKDPENKSSVIFIVNFEYILHIDLTPNNIYLAKFNNRNTRKMCETRSKLTMKTIEKGVKHVKNNNENNRKRYEACSKLTMKTIEKGMKHVQS